jgi:hypothetical protein
MIGNKLSVGILTNTKTMPAWAFYVIQQIQTSDYSNVSLVIEEVPSEQSLTKRIVHAYLRAERRSSQMPTRNEIKSLLNGIPTASPADPNLPAYNLDLILHLGARPAPSHFVEATRFGIWEISDGKQVVHSDDLPGFFEVFYRKPITDCAVFSTNGETSLLLVKGPIATDPISVSRNRENFFWKAAFLLLKAIRMLSHERKLTPEVKFEMGTRQFNGSRPNILDLMRLAVNQVSRFTIKKVRKRFYRDQWILMLAKNTGEIVPSWDAFQPIYPPMKRFWADPFVLERENRYYVFFEELLYETNLGRLACAILDLNGNILENRTILEKPYHLSYPFIFEFDETLYMIPETGANKTIDLYRCRSFPFEWDYHKTLFEGVEAKDATLLEQNGKWWLFATMRENEHGSTWDQLSIFWADNPFSNKWTPHPLNPVVVDVRTARPAGYIFSHNGVLIRPSQDCSVRYGYALNFNRITKLSEKEYEEKSETRFEPPAGTKILATHTFNKSGQITIIDAVLRRRK